MLSVIRYSLAAIVSASALSANIYVDTTPRDIAVVGDSMAVNWPTDLAALYDDREVFNWAIGGTTSLKQIRQFNGVYIDYPQNDDVEPDDWTPDDDSITAGTVTIRINRNGAHRTYASSGDRTYEAQWPAYVAKVSNPSRVFVLNNGERIGEATHNTFEVTTDYGTDINRIYAPAHGLSDGDLVAFWMDSATGTLPSGLVERKVYEVTAATADDFELIAVVQEATPVDIGSDASGTMICESGWTLDWEYAGGDWDLSLSVVHDYSARIILCQTTTNDVDRGDPAGDYHRWPTHTLPAIEYLRSQQRSYPKRIVYVTPTLSHEPGFGSEGDPNYEWINGTVRVWADAQAAADANFIYVDPYRLAVSEAVYTAEELALLDDPEVPQALHIRGDPHTPASWEAFATDQGDTFHRMVGPGYMPLHFRSGTTFSDSGHWDDDDGAEWLAQQVFNAIESAGW